MSDLSLTIDTGVKRIAINDDPQRVIEFNPADILFAQKYYQLVKAFKEKEGEYKTKAAMLEDNKAQDENGIPLNVEARLQLLKELCDFTRSQIDKLFGEGASQKAFGDSYNINVFPQFFEGMKQFIEPERQEKVNKYINKARPKHAKTTKN